MDKQQRIERARKAAIAMHAKHDAMEVTSRAREVSTQRLNERLAREYPDVPLTEARTMHFRNLGIRSWRDRSTPTESTEAE